MSALSGVPEDRPPHPDEVKRLVGRAREWAAKTDDVPAFVPVIVALDDELVALRARLEAAHEEVSTFASEIDTLFSPGLTRDYLDDLCVSLLYALAGDTPAAALGGPTSPPADGAACSNPAACTALGPCGECSGPAGPPEEGEGADG